MLVRAATKEVEKSDKKPEAEAFEDMDYPEVAPTTQQVQDFLNTLVKETEIAEMHLQMGSFQLKVKRSMHTAASVAAAAAAAAAPAAPVFTVPPPRSESSSLAVESVQSMDESVDESLMYVPSPKVGIFRRGRYAGGKRVGKGNIVNEGDQLRKGQTIAFVEQLGTFVAIEAPQAGELTKFEIEDGQAVEYGQTVVELAPFFGGHIIGDKKYA